MNTHGQRRDARVPVAASSPTRARSTRCPEAAVTAVLRQGRAGPRWSARRRRPRASRPRPDGFHDLLIARARPAGQLGVAPDAVRALGDVRGGDRDQLLGLGGQGAVGEHLPAERVERMVDRRGELTAAVTDLAGGRRIDHAGHGRIPFLAAAIAVCAPGLPELMAADLIPRSCPGEVADCLRVHDPGHVVDERLVLPGPAQQVEAHLLARADPRGGDHPAGVHHRARLTWQAGAWLASRSIGTIPGALASLRSGSLRLVAGSPSSRPALARIHEPVLTLVSSVSPACRG